MTPTAPAPVPADLREPDRDQIEMFTDALFRHARPGGFVSLRAFYETDSTKPFRIIAVAIGDSLRVLIDEVAINARLAANHPQGVVFCPPIATFKERKGAKETDIAEGLALSVECDERPNGARERLEAILAPRRLWWLQEASGSIRRRARPMTSCTSIGVSAYPLRAWRWHC